MENIDWKNLGFSYIKTDSNVRCYWKDGKWGELTLTSDEYIPLHMACTALHYGQDAFEGLKAFRGKDGKIRIFRMEENAKRLISSGEYLRMAAPSIELCSEAVVKVVKANERFVPPYGTGASLYIRPLLIGSGAQVGVKPADEFLFLVFVTPVGPYYKEGFHPIKAIVDRDHDRAAPLGTGHIKAGGNYGASLISGDWAHELGYSSVIYLDAAHKKYIDECGAMNFFGVRGNSYITPQSHSVLPSITNMSLCRLAEDAGMTVERRNIPIEEIETFDEAGGCGTAAVISPLSSVFDPGTGKTYTFGDGASTGKWSTLLYNKLRAIQLGDEPDPYGWNTVL